MMLLLLLAWEGRLLLPLQMIAQPMLPLPVPLVKQSFPAQQVTTEASSPGLLVLDLVYLLFRSPGAGDVIDGKQ